jgi:hypothetical protein
MEWRWRILLVSLHVISTAPFSCDNNQRTFPLHYLNDDYCDCMDGSDETTTAACSHVQQSLKVMFTCTDTRTVQTIPTSMVNDGVCDCCDGSDEMVVSCPLICKHKLYTLRKEMSNFAKTQAVGATTNTKLLYGGTGKKNERTVSVVQGHFLKYKEAGLLQYNTDILKKQTELKQVRDYIHQSIKKLQHDGHEIDPSNPTARVDPRALQYYAMTKQHLDVLHYHVSMLTTLSENDLGPNLQYLHLLTNGTCYPSPVINEKRLKGGTPNVIPQLYQFEFCPFKHVTQFEINHTFWETNEKLIKAGLPIVNELPKNVLEQLGIGLPLVSRKGKEERGEEEEETEVMEEKEVMEVMEVTEVTEVMEVKEVMEVMEVTEVTETTDRNENGAETGEMDETDRTVASERGSARSVRNEVLEESGILNRVLTFFGLGTGLGTERYSEESSNERGGGGSGVKNGNMNGKSKSVDEPPATIKRDEKGVKTVVGVYEGWGKMAMSQTMSPSTTRLQRLTSFSTTEQLIPVMVFQSGHPCQEGIGLQGETKRSIRVWFICGKTNRT